MAVDIGVNHQGENIIAATLKRVEEGIQVNVLVHEDIENFFRRWSSDIVENVRDCGRLWHVPKDKHGTPVNSGQLQAWGFKRSEHDDSVYLHGFTLHSLGRELQTRTESGNVPNISFIRMVGASNGVSFVVDTMMSKSEMDMAGQRIQNACAVFYKEYIKPIQLNLTISRGSSSEY